MQPPESFTRFIAENQLFSQQSRVLLALSGGKDSVLLAYLLKAGNYTFGIAHCNFQLRGSESDGDEQFCRQLAEKLQVPFNVSCFDTLNYAKTHQISIQMAARNLRYSWFEQVRQQQGYDVIAVAHHQNDAIETILLNLVRGTGIAGLHGILPVNGRVVRPMLGFTREQIDELVSRHQLAYREDSSNASVKYARNKLRHQVIPQLKELNPDLEHTFQRNLQHFKDLETLLQYQLAQVQPLVWGRVNGVAALSVQAIGQLPVPRLLLPELLRPYGFNRTTVEDLLSALTRHPGRRFISLTHQLTLDRDWVLLEPLRADIDQVIIEAGTACVNYNGRRLNILQQTQSEIIRHKNVAVIDAALLQYPLVLRPWQQGDWFYPLGMQGRKKLSDFFISQKIPLSLKRRIPILVNGNGEVIWIGGYRADNRYKVTAQTQKVTIFELDKQHYE